MATSKCGKCGATWPRGDQAAAFAHRLRCPKSVARNGLYFGKKYEQGRVNAKRK